MKPFMLPKCLGTRLSEKISTRPKPMVEIGGKPILWHILKMHSNHGVNDFVICYGYKGDVIKEYFANYFLRMSDVTSDMRSISYASRGRLPRHLRFDYHRQKAVELGLFFVQNSARTEPEYV